MNSFLQALLFTLLAAVGNAMFVYGQKKSTVGSNPFLFVIMALIGCVILLAFASLAFPMDNLRSWASENIKPVLITAVGLFILYIGFYFLYSRFGASYYTLYAVLSIVTTSIIVGAIFFNEKFNIYHLGSILFAILTILFFFIGQKVK